MSNTTKAVFLLERTKDSTSNIIGFYSSEDLAIDAVKRLVEARIDIAVSERGPSDDHIGIYIQEGFMISKNEVEVDDNVDFEKIEDPEEFYIAEDLGDVKDTRPLTAEEQQEMDIIRELGPVGGSYRNGTT